MHQLSERAVASRELIEALSQRSEEIQRVTLVIQSIASQTNLLALIYDLAREGARLIGQKFEADIDQGRASLDDLFDRSYKPVANTSPTRFTRWTMRAIAASASSMTGPAFAAVAISNRYCCKPTPGTPGS